MMSEAILNNKNIATQAGVITVYNFDAVTREYLSSTIEHLAIGVGIPDNSAADAPPVKKKGKAICRAVNNLGWEYVADHRGEFVYSTESGETIEITSPGNYPAGTTITPPATSNDKWDGEKWVTDIVAQHTVDVTVAEQRKTELLKEAKATISIWQTELQLEIINDDDKVKLISWLTYIKELQAVEIDAAPNINWPTVPAA